MKLLSLDADALDTQHHAFDFWYSRWHIRNQRLKKRLAGCTEWEQFDAAGNTYALPGGIGNYDDFTPVDWRPGFVGMTLRVFSRETGRWSIFWLDNLSGGLDPASGFMNSPVVGGFENGIGTFMGRETFEGRPVLVRFVWDATQPDQPRWHQAFSEDEGQSWEINWIMSMTRAGDE